jgi:hypothetical protein
MSAYSRLQRAWLTAAENAVATLAAREIIIDVTNWRPILHDGSTAGGKPIATEAYVQEQIANLASGNATNIVNFATGYY